MSFWSKLFKNVDVTINVGGMPPPPPPPPPALTLAQRVQQAVNLPSGPTRDARLQRHVDQALAAKDFALATHAAASQTGFTHDSDLQKVSSAALSYGDTAAAARAARAMTFDYSRNDQLVRVAETAMNQGDLAQAASLVNEANRNPMTRPANLDTVQGRLGDAFLARGQLGQAINVAKGMWDLGKQTDLLTRVTNTALSRRQFGVAQTAIREVRDYNQQRKLQRSYDQLVLPPPPPPPARKPGVTVDFGPNVTITFN